MIEDYLKRLTGVLALGAAFAAIPLFASLADLQPPWPPAIGYVSAALVLIGALLAWEWTRSARVKYRRRWIIISLLLTLVGLFCYLTAYSLFIENVPATKARLVRGYECTADAARIYPHDCPDLPQTALRDAGWEAVGLWTRQSVTIARMLLTLSWLIFTMGLITTVGSIVAGRQGRKRATKPGEQSVT